MNSVRLGDFLGVSSEEDFMEFDLSEVEIVLQSLKEVNATDLSHAEFLQQQALRGADIITGYLGKMVKTIGFLEAKVNSVKNRVALEYKAPDGSRTTTDMKLWAAGCSSEVEEVQITLAKAKASKLVLDNKYSTLIKTHHHYRDIAQGIRKTVIGYTPSSNEKIPEGYE